MKQEKSEIECWIKEWFENEASITLDLDSDDLSANYFERGWIDSFSFINLITSAEEHFKITFSNDEFQNRKFAQISGLIEIISEKTNV